MITAGSATPAWGSQSLTLQRQSIGGQRTGTRPGRGGAPPLPRSPSTSGPAGAGNGKVLSSRLPWANTLPGLSALEATTTRAARRRHEPGKNPAAAWEPSTISSPGWAPRHFAKRVQHRLPITPPDTTAEAEASCPRAAHRGLSCRCLRSPGGWLRPAEL